MVGLPVSLGLLALLFLVVTVVVCLCVLVLRKKREVRFRRVVFQRMDDDIYILHMYTHKLRL